MRANFLVGLAAASALCACGGDLSSPLDAYVVQYSTGAQAYGIGQVRLQTLTSLRHLRGGAAEIRVGAHLRQVPLAAAASGTVEDLRGRFQTQAGAEVNLAYTMQADAAYPENFPALALLTAYANLEKSRNALLDWGLDPAAGLPAQPVIAQPVWEGGASPLTEGELYYPPLAAFLLPAASSESQVPLVLNRGAVAHAVAHEAIQRLVWGGAPLVGPEQAPSTPAGNSAKHLARSITEGLADYFAAAISEDPRWVVHSLPQSSRVRVLEDLHCGSVDMADALPLDDATAPYDPFPLATVLAGALNDAARAGAQVSARGVVAALPELGKRAHVSGGQLSLQDALDALVATAAPERKALLCPIFADRFARLGVQAKGFPACAGVTPAPLNEFCQ